MGGATVKDRKEWILKLKEIGIFRLGLMIVAGIILLVLSFPQKSTTEQKEKRKVQSVNETDELEAYIENMEERLTKVLEQVDGIGKVQVMITAKSSKEQIVLKDTPYSRTETEETDSQGGTRDTTQIDSQESTVLEEQEDGSKNPYITMELQPEIEGVLVIAKGAGDNKIIAEINEAVTALFSVPSHKIKVMKMK